MKTFLIICRGINIRLKAVIPSQYTVNKVVKRIVVEDVLDRYLSTKPSPSPNWGRHNNKAFTL